MKGQLVDGAGRVFTVEPIAPGLYTDEEGSIHIVAAEILRRHGWEDTEANRDLVVEAAQEVVGRMFPGVPVDLIDARGRRTP